MPTEAIFADRFIEYNCKTAHRQCYWEDLKQAQYECARWTKCKMLFQSEDYSPASPGNPVYWARGGSGSQEMQAGRGDILWQQLGTNAIHTDSSSNRIIILEITNYSRKL